MAKIGNFKFERSDFNWDTSEVTLELRTYLKGTLIIGKKKVKVLKLPQGQYDDKHENKDDNQKDHDNNSKDNSKDNNKKLNE